MKTINFKLDNEELSKDKKRVIALGKFNSFHLGHQKLFKKCLSLKKQKNLEIIIMLYPDYDGFSKKNINSILPLEERKNLLKKYGIDYCLIFESSAKNYQITRERFLDYLKNKLNVTDIVLGKNFSFNKNKDDDFILIKNSFNLHLIEIESFDKQIISTTLIENLLEEAAIEDANKLLGFNYFFNGPVVHGHGLGKKYNTPTANVDVNSNLFFPAQGIYLSKVLVKNKYYFGITSISNNPTFKKRPITFETHIFNFDFDIYGEIIYVELIKFMRYPVKFTTIEKLFSQIELDKREAVKIINAKNFK